VKIHASDEGNDGAAVMDLRALRSRTAVASASVNLDHAALLRGEERGAVEDLVISVWWKRRS